MALDVVGPAEVATLLNVHPVTVNKWTRAGKLPKPDARLAMGPVWRRSTILTWAALTGRRTP